VATIGIGVEEFVELEELLSESCETEKAREEKELWGTGGGGGRLAIGIVIRANDTTGDVQVGESTLIRAVEGYWTLLDNELLL